MRVAVHDAEYKTAISSELIMEMIEPCTEPLVCNFGPFSLYLILFHGLTLGDLVMQYDDTDLCQY